jgi:hypothetical protein
LRKSGDNLVVGRRVCNQKLPDLKPRRKPTVSREHLVAIIPPVQVLDGVRIDVPAVVVPVHVDRAKHTSVIVYKIIYITASQTMTS